MDGFGGHDQDLRHIFVQNTLRDERDEHVFLTSHVTRDLVELKQSCSENLDEFFDTLDDEVVDLLCCVRRDGLSLTLRQVLVARPHRLRTFILGLVVHLIRQKALLDEKLVACVVVVGVEIHSGLVPLRHKWLGEHRSLGAF